MAIRTPRGRLLETDGASKGHTGQSTKTSPRPARERSASSPSLPAGQDGSLNVQYLKGVGPRRSVLLERLGIETIADLVEHFPRRWEDRRPLASWPADQGVESLVVKGRVIRTRLLSAGARLMIFKAEIGSSLGHVFGTWFKYRSRRFQVFETLQKTLAPGTDIWMIGRPQGRLGEGCEIHVEEHYVDCPGVEIHVGGLTPVYPLTEGIEQKLFRDIEHAALKKIGSQALDIVPVELRLARRLLARPQALSAIHFPGSRPELGEARRRLAYEELLLLGLAWRIKRHQTKGLDKGFHYAVTRRLLSPFKERLRFDFTRAQKRVINEIFSDMQEARPMTRLLQGDVGSGKTVVALSALLLAVENGAQGVLMAPSEILAEQHAATLAHVLKDIPVRICLLTSRVKGARRVETLGRIQDGEADLAVGTQALLEEDVVFKNLRLAVIDEQHRFGVRQRATLRRKGRLIDLLVMTATPIPRTLALALYGDLDISTLDQMPPGRRSPRTFFSSEPEAFGSVRREIGLGRQAYVVYPVIEESAARDLRSAKSEFERLAKTVFFNTPIALIHGAMKGADKVRAMEDFSRGKTRILVATQVIEIGIDVPNASIIVIQNAERFGLASLHQLRGRVGRGGHEGECHLVGDPKTAQARRRVEIMLASHDGFRISEEDLKLRGHGELLGMAQHGELGLRVADLARDAEILKAALEDADQILGRDARLESPAHQGLRLRLRHLYQRRWSLIDLA